MVLGEIDGDSMNGICFVGVNNKIYKIIFVIMPIGISLSYSIFHLVRVFLRLWALKNESTEVISKIAKSKIKSAANRVVVIVTLIIILVSSMFLYYINEYRYDHLWKDSLRKYIV